MSNGHHNRRLVRYLRQAKKLGAYFAHEWKLIEEGRAAHKAELARKNEARRIRRINAMDRDTRAVAQEVFGTDHPVFAGAEVATT